ncbi:hypothetical protein Kpol_1024p11 [Vanderwaltozyma polyspora DSM 70294]|uniref:TATA-binding protein interacting (TIP20) domain-containing protein n=1 Tax=Vanderwaltozyma polyspora (strain ATCC 22028 / DSM 70294 / BCRC 21397 / CBS 2163 / NBRC 10782 / NRRL Y-8283 / UCD 57-17) TaxID=436907 RepID=A7TLH2_VANPO|nr:uncharacterized protein Kpol_1024p11 [Vanderwaltozyma polyspora DSM 70294]EDO16858.1 hypothetical protein Kpol_1024p11 [Vanderwaltozyma polyspora DSM 70294]
MDVKDAVSKYKETNDVDVKYMLLRQDFKIETIPNDLVHLLNQLLFPILLNETDLELIDLVSSEVFPVVIKKGLLLTSINGMYNANFMLQYLIEPFLRDNESRNTMMITTLRNILKNIDSKKIIVDKSGAEEIIRYFIEHFNKHNESYSSNRVMYWETLLLLLQFFYDSEPESNELSTDIIKSAILFTNNGLLDSSIKDCLVYITKNTSNNELSRIVEIASFDIIEIISVVWNKFNVVVEKLLDRRIIPSIIRYNEDNDISDELILTQLKTLSNLHKFFDTNILLLTQDESGGIMTNYNNKNTKYISDILLSKLREALMSLLLLETSKFDVLCERNETEYRKGFMEEDDNNDEMELDDDADQQAYLEELEDDQDEEPFLEEEGNIVNNEDIKSRTNLIINETLELLLKLGVENINNFEIFEIMKRFNIKLPNDDVTDNEMEFNEKLIASMGFEELCENSKPLVKELGERINENIEVSIELERWIHTIRDVVVKLNNNRSNYQYEQQCAEIENGICSILTPLLKPIKTYITTIKVGNMKQSIDEGITIRTSIYGIVSQLNDIEYSRACEVIIEMIQKGLKERENYAINQLAMKTLEKQLSLHRDDIQGLNEDWYQNVLIPKVHNRLLKLDAIIGTQEEDEEELKDDTVLQQKIQIINQLKSLFV